MRQLDYFPSRIDLYTPGESPTVLNAVRQPSENLICAEFSRLAYRQFTEAGKMEIGEAASRAGFSEVNFYSSNGTQVFAAWNAGTQTQVLAFRGTEADPTDIATDLAAWSVPWPQGGRVHAGFAQALDWVWERVEDWVGARPGKLLLTGHSLGAALATLAASRLPQSTLVTIGSPRVGDRDFAATLTQTTVLRYVSCCDVVCRVPPSQLGFSHAGTALYIDRNGAITREPGKAFMVEDQARAREEYLAQYAWRIGNVSVRDLADHAPLNYVVAVGA